MSKKHNDIEKMILAGIASTALTQICKPIIEQGFTVIKNNLFYAIDIQNQLCGITDGLQTKFQNYPSSVEFHMGETYPGIANSDRVKYTPMGWALRSDYQDITFYRGTPILLRINKFSNGNDGRISENGAWLITFNHPFHKQNLKEFLEDVEEVNRQIYVTRRMEEKEYNVKLAFSQNGQLNLDYISHHLRTFDDVFIPSDIKNKLINSIDAYVNNRDFYINNNIPNHFGILLYSKPGYGKSSIAQAIASHLNAELTVASGDCIKHVDELINRMGKYSMDDSLYRVLLFEDIDSGLFNLTRENKDKDENKDEVGMATILNALDGIGAPSNIIYIFTTNHIEALDPAFIRPGRCDLHLEIPCVTEETLREFIQFHFPKESGVSFPKDVPMKENLTFATLQTYVMEGKSAKEIVDIAYDV